MSISNSKNIGFRDALSYFSGKEKRFQKIIGIFAILMSFNSILVLGSNISIFVFVFFILIYISRFSLFSLKYSPHFIIFGFIFGVFLSVIDVNASGENPMSRSLIVLPNYIYWALLCIILINLRDYLEIPWISRNLLIGLILTLIFYQFRKTLNFSFLKSSTPNSYAFVLVCFSAVTVSYIKIRYGMIRALMFLGVILASMLSLERRAGFVLVLISSLISLFLGKIKLNTILTSGISAITLFVILQLSFVENYLAVASPRIYELLYENDELASTDQSYLTRLAMTEKGLTIFSQNPLTGIGLNNFTNNYVELAGNFKGSELIINKLDLNTKSAHSSYIVFLSEGGLFVFVPFICLFLYNLFHFVIAYNRRKPLENAYYLSLISMFIHLYFISEIVNVFAWFLIGVVSSLSVKYSLVRKSA